MRRCLGLAALPLLLVGCISSSNEPPGEDAGLTEDSSLPTTEDTGAPPMHDATLPVDSSVGEDSAVPTQDSAPSIDAAPPPVTLLVTNDLGPEPGVLIFFHDATGSPTGSATTGISGTVTADLPANAQVTAVLQGPNGMALVTIQGVQPGDALTAFDGVNPSITAGTVTVESLPDASALDDAGANYKVIVGACQASGSSTPITVSADYPCEIGGQFPVLVVDYPPSGGAELAYTYAKGGVLPLDGGPALVSPTTPWASTESAPVVTTSGTPALSDVGTSVYERIAYGEIAGGVAFTTGLNPASGDDGGLLATFVGHPGYPDAVQAEATLRQYLSSYVYSSYEAIATHTSALDGGSPGPSIDLSQILPQVTGSTVDATDAGTPSRPLISWTTTGSLAGVDGIIVQTNFTLTYEDGGSGPGNTPWTIVAPPTATSVTPPALPATFATPAAITGQYVVPVIVAVEASYLTGYAQMRHAFATLTPTNGIITDNSGPIAPTLPVDGTLRLSAVTQAGD